MGYVFQKRTLKTGVSGWLSFWFPFEARKTGVPAKKAHPMVPLPSCVAKQVRLTLFHSSWFSPLNQLGWEEFAAQSETRTVQPGVPKSEPGLLCLNGWKENVHPQRDFGRDRDWGHHDVSHIGSFHHGSAWQWGCLQTTGGPPFWGGVPVGFPSLAWYLVWPNHPFLLDTSFSIKPTQGYLHCCWHVLRV